MVIEFLIDGHLAMRIEKAKHELPREGDRVVIYDRSRPTCAGAATLIVKGDVVSATTDYVNGVCTAVVREEDHGEGDPEEGPMCVIATDEETTNHILRLQEKLRFYADPASHVWHGATMPVMADGGSLARSEFPGESGPCAECVKYGQACDKHRIDPT